MDSEIHVWMPMIGFDREESDKGAAKALDRMPFLPQGISAFLFHPDIVNQHDGMTVERTLPPDNCSYYGSPRNEDRCRQEWTNHDLRDLVVNLADRGVEPYLGIMGVDLNNRWHNEWISEHPEVRFAGRTFEYGFNVLKRLADGTYYEDFFADKLCQTLVDYGFAGLQVADNFCPSPSTLYNGDFSADMFGQFLDQAAVAVPEELATIRNGNSHAARNARGNWIWRHCREEWIEFHAWRWEGFWRKICDRLHAIGRKAIVLGMYCTDPFETLYCKGIDLSRLARAGVDYLMPNIVPTGLRLQHPDRPDRFHRYMALAPLTAAFVPGTKLLSLLGVKDATEEWDVLHHAPCLLERDVYTLLGYLTHTAEGFRRCLAGLMVCLGDGIHAEEWQWLRERIKAGLVEDVQEVLAPTLLWSDAALYNTLPAYIRTRRWTLHRFYYEMAERGVPCGAVARTERLDVVRGPLFVPNFDLLSEQEQQAVAAYRHGPVVCTAAVAECAPADYGIEPDVYVEDQFSNYPMCAFAFHADIADQSRIMAPVGVDDGIEDLQGDPADAPEHSNVLAETLTFRKVSTGFREALALLLKELGNGPFVCNLPILPMRLADGRYRLCITNPEINSYGYADVTADRPVQDVRIVSKYPLLPVKFMDSPNGHVGWNEQASDGTQRTFRAKVAPGGVTILDIRL